MKMVLAYGTSRAPTPHFRAGGRVGFDRGAPKKENRRFHPSPVVEKKGKRQNY